MDAIAVPPPLIYGIFFRSTKYDNSVLYRDILSFASEQGHEGGFKFNKLGNWLIQNNTEFRNYYTDSNARIRMSARLANKTNRIRACLDNLLRCGFITIVGKAKAEKNGLDTPLYEATLEGDLFSCLIQISQQEGHDNSLSQKLLDILETLAKETDSAILIFVLDFFKRSFEKNYFDSLVSHFIRIVLPSSKITDGKELLSLFLGLKNSVNWILADKESFLESLANLDFNLKKAVLFQFKTEIENYYLQNYFTREWKLSSLHRHRVSNDGKLEDDIFYKNIALPSTYWQNKRIERASDYENAIIPSICPKCKSNTAFEVKVKNYLQLLAALLEPYPSQVVSGDCMKCGEKYSVGAHLMTLPFYTSPWT